MNRSKLLLVPALYLLLFAAASLSTSGCSGSDHRRLSAGETLNYKRELIRKGELSPSQVTEFGSDTRRTKAEIDSLYSRLSAESADERAKERAFWENELRRNSATEALEP